MNGPLKLPSNDILLFLFLKYYSPTVADGKTFVLVFCVLHTVIHKTQKTRTKVLPSAMVGE